MWNAGLDEVKAEIKTAWRNINYFRYGLDGITDSMDVSLSQLQEMVKDENLACCSPWSHKELEMTEQLNHNWFQW